MGAINYGTSDFITLGLKPYDRDDFADDPDFIDEDGELDAEMIDDYISECYECDEANAAEILNRRRLYYYNIEIKAGYYEGLYIDIESNFGTAYDNFADKREAQKEITYVKSMLHELNGIGFHAVAPGWCTSYYTYDETRAKIDEAIREMRETARNTPTWTGYFRDEYPKKRERGIC